MLRQCQFLFSIAVILVGCQTPQKLTTEQAATLLSHNLPNLSPKYFESLPGTGRHGVWVSAERPRYSGAIAFVTLEDSLEDDPFVLMTIQERTFKKKKGLFLEGPAGGFDGPMKEPSDLFHVREHLLYEASLNGEKPNHQAIDLQAKEMLSQLPLEEKAFQKEIGEQFKGGDFHTYNTAIREGVEESGVMALLASDQRLAKEGVRREIKVMGVLESYRYIVPCYHIRFQCKGCKKSSLFQPHLLNNDEIIEALWIAKTEFQEDGVGKYVAKTPNHGTLPVKPYDWWNEILGEALGHSERPLLDINHAKARRHGRSKTRAGF